MNELVVQANDQNSGKKYAAKEVSFIASQSVYKNTSDLRRKFRRKKNIFPMSKKWLSDGKYGAKCPVGIQLVTENIPTGNHRR